MRSAGTKALQVSSLNPYTFLEAGDRTVLPLVIIYMPAAAESGRKQICYVCAAVHHYSPGEDESAVTFAQSPFGLTNVKIERWFLTDGRVPASHTQSRIGELA